MKTFVADTEERYVWNCPYCGEICESLYDSPDEQDIVECEHCGKEAKCEYVEH